MPCPELPPTSSSPQADEEAPDQRTLPHRRGAARAPRSVSQQDCEGVAPAAAGWPLLLLWCSTCKPEAPRPPPPSTHAPSPSPSAPPSASHSTQHGPQEKQRQCQGGARRMPRLRRDAAQDHHRLTRQPLLGEARAVGSATAAAGRRRRRRLPHLPASWQLWRRPLARWGMLRACRAADVAAPQRGGDGTPCLLYTLLLTLPARPPNPAPAPLPPPLPSRAGSGGGVLHPAFGAASGAAACLPACCCCCWADVGSCAPRCGLGGHHTRSPPLSSLCPFPSLLQATRQRRPPPLPRRGRRRAPPRFSGPTPRATSGSTRWVLGGRRWCLQFFGGALLLLVVVHLQWRTVRAKPSTPLPPLPSVSAVPLSWRVPGLGCLTPAVPATWLPCCACLAC